MTTTTSSSSSSSSFLTFIIDLNPHAWAFPSSSSSTESSPLSNILPVLLIFLNSHLALAYGNGVAVYVCSTQGRAKLIYSTASHSSLNGRQAKGKDRSRDGGDSGTDASTYQHFGNLNRAVLKGVQDMVDEMGDDLDEDEQEEDEEPETALVKAFSMALNREYRQHWRPVVEEVTRADDSPVRCSAQTSIGSLRQATPLPQSLPQVPSHPLAIPTSLATPPSPLRLLRTRMLVSFCCPLQLRPQINTLAS